MADEFALAPAIVGARTVACLTQEELVDRMDARQSLVVEATGIHLKITFEL